jgi:hypothetical protein
MSVEIRPLSQVNSISIDFFKDRGNSDVITCFDDAADRVEATKKFFSCSIKEFEALFISIKLDD